MPDSSAGYLLTPTIRGQDVVFVCDARNLSSDGRRLVYHAGARLWLLDPESAGPVPIEVRLGSARPQRGRHFSDPGRHLDTVSLDPDGAGIALTSRGKALALGAWAGPVRRYGQPDGVRYRLLATLATLAGQGRLVAVASDDGETERVVVFAARGDTTGTGCSDVDTGRAVELVPSPTEEVAALTNHRNELLLVDLRPEQPRTTVLDSSRYGQIADPAWSPDGRWLAYTYPTSPNSSAIRLVEPATGTVTDATRPVLADRCPAFDPAGRYLYFIGHRDFDPVYDEQRFDLGFPLGSRPYAVTLRADVPAPFVAQAQAPGTGTGAGTDKSTVDSKEKGEPAAPAPVDIDLAGITRRVVAFPVPLGRYERVAGTAEKVFFSSYPVTGARNRSDDPPVDRTIDCLDLSTLECELYTAGVTDFGIGADHSTMLLRCDERLRVVKAGEKLGDADRPGRVSGWIDLDRVTISVRPQAEWRQMFREAWRLQRENFWVEDMSGVDWAEVYQRYLPLVDRVGTRAEFSDLLWELQGELGTSHATEYGGAYRYRPHYRQGTLGVDWAQPVRPGEAGDGQRIARVLEGDVWDRDATSPLNRPGVDVRAGDEILAVAGIPVGGPVTVASLLVNLAEQEVELLVRRGGEPPREVTVRTLADERAARYRDWVVANRDLVHERTGGRVGYVHLPDMGPAGFGEFFRGYLAEFDREALVVDVRFNRGGHVSALLLEHLARRRLAYAYARWGAPAPYPDEAVRGPLVAVTNENAGSDGDIFSHAFKAMGLGPLVGKRTWGGVIGIWPRHRLADGTVTTQPEFSFAFDDVGWRVENYGTDPTIEVDNTPQDHARGVDAQLERAIEVVLAELAVHPAHTPNPLDRPRLDRMPLPPR